MKLEGNAVTYLVLAAPVIAGAATIIPVLAEATWRERAYLKSLLWWLALVPAGAVVFFSAAERVHVAKAGAQAERVALRSAASRAQVALTKGEASWPWREPMPIRRGLTSSAVLFAGPSSQQKRRRKLTWTLPERELLSAENKATTDSPLQAPVWLLPAALDVVAFMAIWTGLSGHRPRQAVKPVQTKRRARKRKPRAPRASDARAQAQALFRRTANDNVVPFKPHKAKRSELHYGALTVIHG